MRPKFKLGDTVTTAEENWPGVITDIYVNGLTGEPGYGHRYGVDVSTAKCFCHVNKAEASLTPRFGRVELVGVVDSVSFARGVTLKLNDGRRVSIRTLRGVEVGDRVQLTAVRYDDTIEGYYKAAGLKKLA